MGVTVIRFVAFHRMLGGTTTKGCRTLQLGVSIKSRKFHRDSITYFWDDIDLGISLAPVHNFDLSLAEKEVFLVWMTQSINLNSQ